MSQYYWIEGELIFKDKTTLEGAVEVLREGGWIKEDNTMVNEGDSKVNDGQPVINDNVLTIPTDMYRNLGRRMSQVVDQAEAGFYKEACQDGDNYFSVWQNGEKIQASDSDIAKFLDNEKFQAQDLFTLDSEEYGKKWDEDEETYWEMQNAAFDIAMETAFEELDGLDDDENDFQIINYCKTKFEKGDIKFKSEESIIHNQTSIKTILRMLKNESFEIIPDYIREMLERRQSVQTQYEEEKNAHVTSNTKANNNNTQR